MRKYRRRLTWLVVAATLPLGLLLALRWAEQRWRAGFLGPSQAFTLDASPPFLTDALAVEKARETLALNGYDLTAWKPREDRRTHAPDGSADVYLVRNSIDPNVGSVIFVDETRRATNPGRSVDVELVGNRLTCQVVYPK